ncbi:MAG: hypothetical protein L6R40_006388 [Gallowayella cf. fulva]|nr:MAG: hypothetical protein L6R40_006388 [Xanthomendoza cf. fulva]
MHTTHLFLLPLLVALPAIALPHHLPDPDLPHIPCGEGTAFPCPPHPVEFPGGPGLRGPPIEQSTRLPPKDATLLMKKDHIPEHLSDLPHIGFPGGPGLRGPPIEHFTHLPPKDATLLTKKDHIPEHCGEDTHMRCLPPTLPTDLNPQPHPHLLPNKGLHHPTHPPFDHAPTYEELEASHAIPHPHPHPHPAAPPHLPPNTKGLHHPTDPPFDHAPTYRELEATHAIPHPPTKNFVTTHRGHGPVIVKHFPPTDNTPPATTREKRAVEGATPPCPGNKWGTCDHDPQPAAPPS